MHKTTFYLPKNLKAALSRAASARGCSEAALVRDALRQVLEPTTAGRPRLPLFRSGKRRVPEPLDKLLAGFGKR